MQCYYNIFRCWKWLLIFISSEKRNREIAHWLNNTFKVLLTIYIVINPGCWTNKYKCEIKHKFFAERMHIYFIFYHCVTSILRYSPMNWHLQHFSSLRIDDLKYLRYINANCRCRIILLIMIDLKVMFNIRRHAAFMLLYLKCRVIIKNAYLLI